jgi:outer membrane lipoprotein SlyB
MNTTPTPTPSAPAGIHRGVWIGGGLMGLTIIALATTLVVKNSDSVPNGANAATSPLVSTTVTPGATTPDGLPAAPQPTANTPEHEAVRAAHHHSSHDTAAPAGDSQQVAAAAPAACATCGVIDGYSAVQVKGQNNGVGAVAGGLGGALVGSKIAGRNNHTLGGVIGAVGGGLLGNAIESHERTTTAYDVRVRMADGTIRTVRQASVPTVGQRVNVEGNVLHPIADGQV